MSDNTKSFERREDRYIQAETKLITHEHTHKIEAKNEASTQ